MRGRFLIAFDVSLWTVNISRYVLPRQVFEVFDAIGLPSFTVTGVVIASRFHAEPLLIWGPLLAATTAAGGGILRDVLRADADNPALKTSFYAEISVCWGDAALALRPLPGGPCRHRCRARGAWSRAQPSNNRA